jgi:hypothetical protein
MITKAMRFVLDKLNTNTKIASKRLLFVSPMAAFVP